MFDGMLAHLSPERYDRLIEEPFVSPVSIIPEGQSGEFTITKRIMPAETRMKMLSYGGFVRYPVDIELTILKEGEKLWMSDSPSEISDMEQLSEWAKGHVFVAGLGLGLLVHTLALKDEVTKITVVEINQDVINLVKPTLPEKVTVVHQDFKLYLAMNDQTQFDYFILDVYPDLDSDMLRTMLDHWELITKEGKRGGIWGLNIVSEQHLQNWRGFEMPSDFADMADNDDYGEIADFVRTNWNDDDYGEDDEWASEFYGEEEEAMNQFFDSIGIDAYV